MATTANKVFGNLDKDFILKLLGIEVSVARLKCALFPLIVLKVAVSKSL